MKSFIELKKNLSRKDDSLPVIKVALLGDTATQFLAVALQGEARERGCRIELFEAEYNQIERQILDPSSDFHQFGAAYTVVFQSSHKLLEKYSLLPAAQWNNLADERISFVRTICQSVAGRIIYLDYPMIDDAVFGSFSCKVPESFIYQLRKLNLGLMDLSQECQNLFICSISSIQEKFGRDWLFDSSVYISTEMVLSLDAVPYVSARILDIVCALQGRFKKCLILDLDNTLWGGIVGDDGWENIQLGHGLGIGKAFTEFQQWIKKLKNRGIIICVCSKNDEGKAKEPFEKNPEMVLRLDDIAVFVANWQNKADNIRTIQRIIHIGFDSMVFLDDNPFERNLVREELPEVTVPDLPDDPADYLEYLYSLNLFETASYSPEDSLRTRQYQTEARRISSAMSFTNEADYLKSLGMVSQVSGFDSFNTPRVAQLSQRSNQFNLRTIRYTEAEIAAIGADPGYAGFAFTLEDKFGDNGLIGVIILQKVDADTLFIETWLMSCRVLKRGMENFMLNTIMAYASENGFARVIGEYLPTAKNGMVKDHYPQLGFTPVSGSRTARYELSIAGFRKKECFIDAK